MFHCIKLYFIFNWGKISNDLNCYTLFYHTFQYIRILSTTLDSPVILKDSSLVSNNSVRTANKTQPTGIANTNWLMLFKETIAVYTEIHMKQKHTVYGKAGEPFWKRVPKLIFSENIFGVPLGIFSSKIKSWSLASPLLLVILYITIIYFYCYCKKREKTLSRATLDTRAIGLSVPLYVQKCSHCTSKQEV
jgi:hypothetical protein